MTGETERTPEQARPAGNEVALIPSAVLSPNGSGQAGAAVSAAGDEPVRRTAGAVSLYLHAFRRHWAMAISVGLLCAGAAAGLAWYFTPERHTAVAVLRISPNEKQLVFKTAERLTGNDFDIFKGTQKELLTNDVVLIAALRKPEAASQAVLQKEDDPVRWMARNLRVELPTNSEIMRVSLTTSNPAEAALLVQAVVDAYMNEVVDAERHRQQDRLNELDKLYTDKEAEMRTRRTEFKQLAEQLGTGDTGALALKQQIALAQYAEARNNLSRLRSEVQREEDELEGKQAWLKVLSAAPTPNADLLTSNDPMLAHLSDAIEEIDERLTMIRGKLKEPLLSKVSEDYKQMKKTLAEKVAKRQKELDARYQKTKGLSPDVIELKSRLDMLRTQEKTAAKDLEEQRVKTERFGNSSIDVEMMRSELQYLDKVLAPIADEREKLKIELRSTPRITVFQQAEPPKTPDGKPRLVNAGIAGAGGLFGAIFLILSWDKRKQRINSLADLSQGLGLTVVGTVPLLPQKIARAGRRGKRFGKRQTTLDHAVDSIAARLFLRKDAEGVRVVMVSSAIQGEGKTTLAVHLATRLARSGKPTLLVDYDLRKPSIHRIFDMPRGPGVSDCLQTEFELSQIVRPTDDENLSIITAGDSVLESLRPLANGATTSFFEKARAAFAFVVVDCSPILPVIDGLLVSQHADAVVLSVRRDTSRGPQVLLACEKLSAFGSRKHVVVLNGSQEEVFGDYQDPIINTPVEAADTAEAAKTDAAKTEAADTEAP
ncbi:MAG: AAA family ATPase [Thermoguttaceae bacterium]